MENYFSRAAWLLISVICMSCVSYKNDYEVICPEVNLGGKGYCSIPFVEMQANYNNLDNVMISVSGILSVSEDLLLLVDPSTDEYQVPKPYNVVEVHLSNESVAGVGHRNIESLHGRYVSVFGRFKSKNISQGEWKDLIAHGIENAHVIESSP